MSFAELMAELAEVQALKKSMSSDDGDGAGDGAGTGEDGKNPVFLGKSMTVTDENGNKVEAVDGTELVKSLIGRIDTMEAEGAASQEDLAKSLVMIKEALLTQTDVIKSQGELIKSLQGQVATLQSGGRGRQSVVSIVEKPETALIKSQGRDGVTRQEFMAKALDAQKQGRLTSLEVTTAETSLNKGVPIPDHIVRKVLS